MENFLRKREDKKRIEVQGRTFILTALDPLLGNYILIKVMTTILPMGISDSLEKGIGTEIVNKNSSEIKMMSKEEFIDLQKDLLCTIYEELESDNVTPVMRENGTFGISECSLSLIAKLLIESLVFNFKDFFGENLLKKVTGEQ